METADHRPRKRRWKELLVAMVLAVSVLVMLTRSGRGPDLPTNTGTLSDGSQVRLLQLSTGPIHDYFAREDARFLERLAYLLPRRIRREIFGDYPPTLYEYPRTAAPDTLGIWVERDSTVALNSPLQFRVSDAEGNYGTSVGHGTFYAPNRSIIVTAMQSFPRRAEHLRVELQERENNTSQWATVVEWEITNPQRRANRSSFDLVTNATLHGYEMRVDHVELGIGPNRNGTVGSTGSFEFSVTLDGKPNGTWLPRDLIVRDGMGSTLFHRERSFLNGGGTLNWTTWGDYRTRETPFSLKLFLEPHPNGSTNLLASMQSHWTMTNLVNRSRSLTNYAGTHEAFGHTLNLDGYPAVPGREPQLKLVSDLDLQSLEITLVSITDQLGQDMMPPRQPRQGYRIGGTEQYFPLIAHTNSTSFVAHFLIKSFAEVNFVVEPEFAPATN